MDVTNEKNIFPKLDKLNINHNKKFNKVTKNINIIKKIDYNKIKLNINNTDVGSHKILIEKIDNLTDRGTTENKIIQDNNSIKKLKKIDSFKSDIKDNKEEKNINIPLNEHNINNIINSLNKHENERMQKDILDIKKFLINNKLLELLPFKNCDKDSLERILIHCCMISKYKFIEKNTVLYRINDIIDKFYIIIKGKVGIYKAFNSLQCMSGFEYFQYIYGLYLNNEKYLLKLVLSQNYELYPIKENMFPKLNLYVFDILIQRYKNDKNQYINIFTSKEDIIKKCFITSSNYKNHLINNKDKNKKKDVIFDYKLLCKTKDKNIVNIFEYQIIHEYNSGNYFEKINNQEFIDNYIISQNKNKKNSRKNNNNETDINRRKYTAKILSDTEICFFNLKSYYFFLLNEYNKILSKDIRFLTENFMYKKISKQFEEKYFKLFEFEEMNINTYLFEENQPLEYIYFLKEGSVEISLNKNIYKLNELINQLYLIKINKDKINEKTNLSNNNINHHHSLKNLRNNSFNSNKEEIRLIIFDKKDIIGLECLYYDINYFYNAKIISKTANFYKIKKDKFIEILNLDSVEKNYIEESERKMDFMISRLLNLKKIKIDLIEFKNNDFLLKLNNVIKIKSKNNKICNFNFPYVSLSPTSNEENKKKIYKNYNEAFDEKKNYPEKIKRMTLFSNYILNEKNQKYISESKKNKENNIANNNFNKKKLININLRKTYNKINKKNIRRNNSELEKINDFFETENNMFNKNLKISGISAYFKKALLEESLSDNNENLNNSKKKNLFPEILKTPKIKSEEKSKVMSDKRNENSISLRTEKYLLNKIQRQLTYDDLFFTKIKNNNSNNDIYKNNKNDDELINNIKNQKNEVITKKFILSKNKEFIPWKYFHRNINIDKMLNKRLIMKNNWYRNIDQLTEDNSENNYSSTNGRILRIKSKKNYLKLMTNEDHIKNYSSLKISKSIK